MLDFLRRDSSLSLPAQQGEMIFPPLRGGNRKGEIWKQLMRHYPTVPFEHWDRAQEMRRNPTRAEKMLWRVLRSNQLDATFRRQHPIGPYIVDLVCLPKKLVIEVDGGGHVEPDQIEYDKARNQYLTERGFRVRRYFNHDVLRNLEGVLKDIAEALKE